MSQSTFEDDDLFEEAAADIRTEVEDHLDAARNSLPESAEIWSVETDNTLGVLNTLGQALDTGDAAAHLRDAKKAYTMGERADAFEDAEDLADQIEALDTVMDDIETAHDHASDLASTVPELRGALDDAHETAGEEGEASAEAAEEGEASAEAAEESETEETAQ